MDGNVDWGDIKYVWDNGNCTLQEKALQYGISIADILLYAKEHEWGNRGTSYVTTDIDKDPRKLIKNLTISNLAAMSLLLDKNLTPKEHLELQRTIREARETLGVDGHEEFESDGFEEEITAATKTAFKQEF